MASRPLADPPSARAPEPGSIETYVLIGSAGAKAAAEIVGFSPCTGETVRLTKNGVADTDPEVSPDGTTIVFVRATTSADFAPTELWLMDADGSNERRLTSGYSDITPVWAWDGERVLFARGRAGGDDDIMEIRLESGDLTTLVETDGGACAFEPTPSPDGAQLVFYGSSECARFVEGGIKTLENGKVDALACGGVSSAADFSRDGRLAFGDDVGFDGFAQLLIVTEDCSGRHVVIPKDERFPTVGEPHWSPDAAWVTFRAGGAIWIARADGRDLQQLRGSEHLQEADWLVAAP